MTTLKLTAREARYLDELLRAKVDPEAESLLAKLAGDVPTADVGATVEYRQHWQGFSGGRILVDGIEVAKVERRESSRRKTGRAHEYFVVGADFELEPASNDYNAVYAFLEHIGLLTFTEFGLDDGLTE